jgi:hypothetical protein
LNRWSHFHEEEGKTEKTFDDLEGIKQMCLLKGIRKDEDIKRGYSLLDGNIFERFDLDGRVIESHEYGLGKDSKDVTSYDADGFEHERRGYFDGKLLSISRFSYETDAYGNWIKQMEESHWIEDPEDVWKPSSMFIRKIEYFGR